LLRAGVTDLDRALVGELAVVVLVLVHVGSFLEPGGQCVTSGRRQNVLEGAVAETLLGLSADGD
jgi:hypothetical protein